MRCLWYAFVRFGSCWSAEGGVVRRSYLVRCAFVRWSAEGGVVRCLWYALVRFGSRCRQNGWEEEIGRSRCCSKGREWLKGGERWRCCSKERGRLKGGERWRERWSVC